MATKLITKSRRLRWILCISAALAIYAVVPSYAVQEVPRVESVYTVANGNIKTPSPYSQNAFASPSINKLRLGGIINSNGAFAEVAPYAAGINSGTKFRVCVKHVGPLVKGDAGKITVKAGPETYTIRRDYSISLESSNRVFIDCSNTYLAVGPVRGPWVLVLNSAKTVTYSIDAFLIQQF